MLLSGPDLHFAGSLALGGIFATSSRTKVLNFTRVIHLNCLAKIELRGPGLPKSILF